MNEFNDETISDEPTRIEKDTFKGLKNLKKLYLNGNLLESIDPEAFSHTPKLTKLEIFDKEYNNLKLDENMFANLTHLKTIRLNEETMNNNELLESFKKSNINIENI